MFRKFALCHENFALGHDVRHTTPAKVKCKCTRERTSAFAPHGLAVRNWKEMLDQIKGLGFNTIRLPFTNQLFDPSSQPQEINYKLNPDLRGLSGLALMDRFIQGARSRGLKIILDRHDPTADLRPDLWYTDQMPQTRWMQDWVMLAGHYRGNDTVIGADLANEPHGQATWVSGNLAHIAIP